MIIPDAASPCPLDKTDCISGVLPIDRVHNLNRKNNYVAHISAELLKNLSKSVSARLILATSFEHIGGPEFRGQRRGRRSCSITIVCGPLSSAHAFSRA